MEKILRKLISGPPFVHGDLLPDEISLANQLGLSRGTVRLAITRLVHAGVLQRKSGVGTRVAPRAVESTLTAWQSFSKEMQRKGVKIQTFETRCLSFKASPSVAQALRLEQGSAVLRLDRVRGWGGVPVLYSRSWLHPRLGLSGKENFEKPLYEVVWKVSGLTPVRAHEEFVALQAPVRIARSLQISPRSPLLLRIHTVSDADDLPMEYAEVYYRSDRFHLTMDLKIASAKEPVDKLPCARVKQKGVENGT